MKRYRIVLLLILIFVVIIGIGASFADEMDDISGDIMRVDEKTDSSKKIVDLNEVTKEKTDSSINKSGDSVVHKDTSLSENSVVHKVTSLSGDSAVHKVTSLSGDSAVHKVTSLSGDIAVNQVTNNSGDLAPQSATSLSGDSITISGDTIENPSGDVSGETIDLQSGDVVIATSGEELSSNNDSDVDNENDSNKNNQILDQNTDINDAIIDDEDELLSGETLITPVENEAELISGEASEMELNSGDVSGELIEEIAEEISGDILEESGEIIDYKDYPKSYTNVFIKDVIAENNNVKVLIEDDDGNYLDSAIYSPKDYYYLMALTVGMQLDVKIVYNEENNMLEIDYLRFKNSLDSGTLISKEKSENGKVIFRVNGKDYSMNDDSLNLQKDEYVIFETIDGDTVNKRNGKYVLKKIPVGGIFAETKEEIDKIIDGSAIFEISERETKKITKEEVKIGSVYTKIDLSNGSFYLVSVMKAEGAMSSIRVENSQFERKFISIGNREYEMIETNVKPLNEKKKMSAKRTRNSDVTAYLNYLQMPVKIDM